MTSSEIWVNGKKIIDKHPDPRESLISFLRRHGYTGTKLGCAEGGCGSCTVMVSSYRDNQIVNQSVNACLAPAASLHKKHVLTIEGLGNHKQLHSVQEAIAHGHGSQCGFCTPGIVMSLYTELKNNKNPTEHDIEDTFDGNLCRCTGYRPILDSAKKLLHDKCNHCNLKDFCTETGDIEDLCHSRRKISEFPEDLLAYHQSNPPSLYTFEKDGYQWIHPVTVDQVLEIVQKHPDSKIINGNTEVGIETRFKNQNYLTFINVSDVAEMRAIVVKEDGLLVGAASTIAQIQQRLTQLVAEKPEYQTRGLTAILDNIKYFAGKQVRNVSAIAGNIVTASPISDLNPVLMAVGAVLVLQSLEGKRKVKMTEFFLGYRKTALKASEIVVSIEVPFTGEFEFVSAFKQAKRRDDDIAIANAGLYVKLDKNQTVLDCRYCFGGMGPTSLLAPKSMKASIGQQWSRSLIDHIAPLLLEDLPMAANAPGGQVQFRKTLVQSFFFKFVLRVEQALGFDLDPREVSCLQEIHRGLSSGKQIHGPEKKDGVVGTSVMHVAADKQVTGEAQYIDDIPKFHNELYGCIVGSTVSHGNILSVDYSEALKAPGVVGYVDYNDVLKGKEDDDHSPNKIGPVFHDEELFATKTVHVQGQMIAMIVAQSEFEARQAAKLVKVKYESLPAVYTIEEAIEKQSFFPIERTLERGDYSKTKANAVDVPITEAKHFVQGTARMSGQEHFYLETQASIAVPGREDDEMEIYASTQNPTETQHLVAHVLGILDNKVTCRVRRLGGGFGGKESRSVFLSCALAVAARKYERPVRCMLTREEDMATSGTRHPFLGNYKVGFTPEGKLVSLELDIYSNAGYSYDLSLAVLERSLTHCDNAYLIPHMKITGKMCKTNTPTNTAFRGFGGPQGMMLAEQYMTHVAEYLKKPVEHVRGLNLYQNGQVTHFSMPLEEVYLNRAWEELQKSSEFELQRKQVQEFNKQHKYRKRGLTLMPTKFGLAFTARFLNQAGALVHVYTDGSVKIAHGGTEMGQGLHTKMLQIAAECFQIPMSMVYLSETRTDTVANTSATAASVSSDLNGMAVLNACQTIMDRLKPIREKNPSLTWPQLVRQAYLERINLSANGFYKTPDLSFDWESKTGRMFNYFTYGAAMTVVEIDTLTGDHIVLRSDVIMDIGRPINPAIDIGQIEGAFTQGLGWCTIEEPLISPSTGFVLTRGPGLYKIPGFKDIPVDFRVTVMDGVRNSRAIHSSKAVGEPPLFLGASVFFAIKDAIQNARIENGLEYGYFRLDSPATSERIRNACVDQFTKRAETPLNGQKPWGVPA